MILSDSTETMTWTEITRPHYERRCRRYASDLTDEEWVLIAPLMPEPNRIGRPRKTDLREGVNALLYMASWSGSSGMLPIASDVAWVFIANIRLLTRRLARQRGRGGALASVQTRAGSTSAVVGAIQYGSGMIGSAAIGLLANGTPTPMLVVMAVAGTGAWLASLSAKSSAGRR